MGKYRIHINANTPEEVEKELAEAAYILTGLETHLEKWQNQFGSLNRNNLNYWQEKAKLWIEKHKVLES